MRTETKNRNKYNTFKQLIEEIQAASIDNVLYCLKQNTTDVKNIRKYLLAALFNAPSTMDSYYQAKVNHDMPQYAMAR